ncbi:hypothetical protein MNBD_BACTEROID03-1000 [hydrothermal vent metagenome]|uniref:Uncharacterized protein n=1 Tax=hydrothermal vent metagenome TaxID=652676 RepID=A0A3B0T278_9ZZZZ
MYNTRNFRAYYNRVHFRRHASYVYFYGIIIFVYLENSKQLPNLLTYGH